MGRKRKNVAKDDNSNVYIVEKILDKKDDGGVVKYLVKWLDYSSDQNTWEPERNFKNCPEVIEAYEKQLENPEQPAEKVALEQQKSNVGKTETVTIEENYVKAIIGATNQKSKFNPNALLMFMLELSDGRTEFVEREMLHKKCPQLLIDFYQARLAWRD